MKIDYGCVDRVPDQAVGDNVQITDLSQAWPKC